jgi:hypothetical protein
MVIRFVKDTLWDRGLRLVDPESSAFPNLVVTFLKTNLGIHCPTFQATCVTMVGRMIHRRLRGLLHNVSSKYRIKLSDRSKF